MLGQVVLPTYISPAALADLLFTAETDRAYADGGHSLDFINKAFECLDIIGWEHAADVLPSVVGQMVVRDILDFPAQFSPPAEIITLERNYRSTQAILAAANGVIELGQERDCDMIDALFHASR